MTDNSTLRWGILGAGSIARIFVRGLRESQTGTLVAIGSRSQASADKFGEEFGLEKRYASYQDLLADGDIDAVYIATPHPLHAQWAVACAQAKKHILCEKPLTLNQGEAMAVVEAAREHGVQLMEAFMYRCHPQTTRLVELIQSGALGEVKFITASFGFAAGFDPHSRLFDPMLGGGGILDVGCYAASMVRLVAGAARGLPFAEPTQVRGAGVLGRSGVDEMAAATLQFPGDIVAQISTSISLNQENVLRVFGSKGHLLVPSPWFGSPAKGGPNIVLTRDGQSEEVFVPSERSPYALEADALFEAVQKGAVQSPAMSGEDALGNMALLDRWRAEIGLVYPAEKPGNHLPVRGHLQKRADAKMQYGQVAGIDKAISRLVLGCDNQETFPHAAAMFDDFWERGGNAFDTGFIYGGGKMERQLGQWIQARGLREQAMIIGKGMHPPHCNPTALTSQLLETLDRLQTGYVDLYLMHRDNLAVPIGEWVEVLNEHLRAGRIRAYGGSNWSLARVEEGNAYAKERGLVGFSALSNNFSLARMVSPVWEGCVSASDPQSRAWLTQNQLPLFSWSSQARGFFVRGDRNFTADEELVRCWYSDDNFERLERAQQLARQKNTTPINIAAAYILAQPFPLFALIGPRLISETRSSLGAFDVQLSPREIQWLNLEA